MARPMAPRSRPTTAPASHARPLEWNTVAVNAAQSPQAVRVMTINVVSNRDPPCCDGRSQEACTPLISPAGTQLGQFLGMFWLPVTSGSTTFVVVAATVVGSSCTYDGAGNLSIWIKTVGRSPALVDSELHRGTVIGQLRQPSGLSATFAVASSPASSRPPTRRRLLAVR
jgi:hypothetical protein